MDTWIQDYLLLCLRLDTTLSAQNLGPFLDSYFGPAALKAQVEAEQPLALAELTQQAERLLERLAAEDYDPQRSGYLERQTRALVMLSRFCAGTGPPLLEAARGVLDVEPQAVPEATLREALALYDQALPGAGDVRQRFQAWQQRNELPAEKAPQVVALMQTVLAEARRRTQALVPLPEGEALDLQAVHAKPYGAANWYLGDFRSRLELNVTRPINLFGLLAQLCHEGYPGHHAEYALKDAHLYRARGYSEMSLFMLAPQLVISEGLAILAIDMIFTPEEAAAWAAEHVYRPLGIAADPVELAQLLSANALVRSDELLSNAIIMHTTGLAEDALADYFRELTPYSDEQLGWLLQLLNNPLACIYCLSYHQGCRLIAPLLHGPNRQESIRRLLTEQVYPAQLESRRALAPG